MDTHPHKRNLRPVLSLVIHQRDQSASTTFRFGVQTEAVTAAVDKDKCKRMSNRVSRAPAAVVYALPNRKHTQCPTQTHSTTPLTASSHRRQYTTTPRLAPSSFSSSVCLIQR